MPFANRIRLPFKVTRPQYPVDQSLYRFADGRTKSLSVVVKKTYEGETDWLPERWHERLIIALSHDNITIEGDKYLGGITKDGDYAIDWQKFLDYPTAKASFTVQVTPFDNTNDNCQSCEQATQLELVDDTFPDVLDEDQTYVINVADNEHICCYPAVFSITSYDSRFIETATIDQEGNLTIHTKASFVSANSISLVTYRVTCSNGGYDEARVFADLSGDEPGCLAPTNLRLVSKTSTTADFTFDEPSMIPDHYLWRLYKASNPGVLVQTGTCTPTLHISGLIAGTDYVLYVRSQCSPDNGDDNASDFVDLAFKTSAPSNICGQYIANYVDIFGGQFTIKTATYLDCNGQYQTVHIMNQSGTNFCALQTTPGNPVSIVFEDPAHMSYAYLAECP